MLTTGIILGMLLLVALLLARSYVYVAEGEVAVLTRFGRAVRESDGTLRVLNAGLHRKLPWDHLLRVSIKEQSIELAGDEDRTVMTNDGIVIRYQSALRFAPLNDKLEHYLFGLARPIEHMVGTFTCLLRNEIANFQSPPPPTSSATGLSRLTTAEQLIDDSLGAYALIRRERKALNTRVTDFGKRLVGDQFGVRLEAIDVMNFEPPDELREALNTVVQAKNDVDAGLFRAEGECQQRLLAAKKGVEIAQDRARAIEVEMITLGEKLGELCRAKVLDDYVSRRRAEVLSESRQVYVRGSAEQKVNP
ncbi:MAG: SPFH domain-containing protein [Myxococcales bacterium]|nr:SPFH domain-containing protein [Myxococcales bacterium]